MYFSIPICSPNQSLFNSNYDFTARMLFSPRTQVDVCNIFSSSQLINKHAQALKVIVTGSPINTKKVNGPFHQALVNQEIILPHN